MIPLYTESKESLESRKELRCPLEDCVFCGKKTKTWHENTNNPICTGCAKVKKVSEIPEDFGSLIRGQKRAGTYDRKDSIRAN